MFPDRVIVLFKEVEIDLYLVIIDGIFFKKGFTLLYVSLLSEEIVGKEM